MVRRLVIAWVAAAVLAAVPAARAQMLLPCDLERLTIPCSCSAAPAGAGFARQFGLYGPTSKRYEERTPLVPTQSSLGRLGLERCWMALVPVVGTERLLSISLDENLLFAQTNMANFHVYEAESGRLLWSTNLGRPSATAREASVNSRLVFVTNSNDLIALDRQTGRLVWELELGFMPSSPTACDEERVMVGLVNGKLVGFDLYDPKDKTKALYTSPHPVWNWQTQGGALTSRPLPAEQFVAFGGADGRLYVALSARPELQLPVMLYRIPTGGAIAAPLGKHGTRIVLVPSADKNVYAVDLFTAEVKWSYPTGAPVMQEPLSADDDVYAVNVAGLLTAIDVKTGEQRWMTSTHGGRLLSISGSRIYLESHDDDLFIVDRGTGQILADPRATRERAGLNLREFTVGMTNSQDDRIYMATPSGLLICLCERGQLQPRPLRDPKLPPFGYVPPEGALPPSPTTPAAAPATNEPNPAAGAPAPGGEAPPPAGNP
jgi:outer membrane protein assembly factor BamB